MSYSELATNQYYIRNKDTFAGRNLREDRSLLPKRVVCPTDSAPDLWQVERLPNGRYRLVTRGSPTGEKNSLLFAFLIDTDNAEEWVITKRPNDGSRSLYTIEKANGEVGWTRQTDGDDQIAVRPLTATKSLPPQYPPNQLWNIQPLVD